jgi:hypothetical protein
MEAARHARKRISQFRIETRVLGCAQGMDDDGDCLDSGSCPFALLRRAAVERLPLVLTDEKDFKAASALVRVRYLKAEMQVVVPQLGGGPQPGIIVDEITPLGWIALRLLSLDNS